MKKLLSLVAAMIIAATTFAQVNEVTLTTIGTGPNEEQATLQALRSAIEQSFGTFVSANTTILNDQLVQDEIVSVSNGNVKEYQKLAVATLPNGQVSVSAKVTVSVNKLITYAKSKGSRAEFAGQAFSANLKVMQLRAVSTQKTMDLLVQQLDNISKDMFDFKLALGEPRKKNGVYNFNSKVEVYSNAASTNFYNLLCSTLDVLNLSSEEIKFCKNSGIETSRISHVVDIAGTEGIKYYTLPIKDFVNYMKKIDSMVRKAHYRFTIAEIGNSKNRYTHEIDQTWHIVILPSYCLNEKRTPIKLSKQQQKEVKKGTYNGPTFTIEYTNPTLLKEFSMEFSASNLENGQFQGFEIKY